MPRSQGHRHLLKPDTRVCSNSQSPRRGRPPNNHDSAATQKYVQDLQRKVLDLQAAYENVVDSRTMLLSERDENQHLHSEIRRLESEVQRLKSENHHRNCKLGQPLLVSDRAAWDHPSPDQTREQANGVQLRESARAGPPTYPPFPIKVVVPADTFSRSKGLLGRNDPLTQREIGLIHRMESLAVDTQQLAKIIGSYIADADRMESTAESVDVSTFSIRMEMLINDSFSTARPRVVEQTADHAGTTGIISWTDLIRKGVPETRFERRDDDTYRCCIGGYVVEMSKRDRDAICSGVVQKMLRDQDDPEKIQREYDSHSLRRIGLTRLREDCFQGESCSGSAILCFIRLTLAVFGNIQMILSY
ncbi:hypothetical protein N7523_005706 [Penicillium sp. IBT 18751x]|nr:hypothetical protein N7523_005706 [Penicillium sp. IBT 18751x]